MPRGDGTGPAGMGPMTGRAAGYCAGYGVPGFMNPIPGGGRGMAWGRGGGFGRGLGRGFRGGRPPMGAPVPPGAAYTPPPNAGVPYPHPAAYAGSMPADGASSYTTAPTPQQEAEALKGQAEHLEDMLEGIKQRISELEQEENVQEQQ